MIIKQILGAFFTGFSSIFVMLSSALSFQQQIEELKIVIIAAFFGVSVLFVKIIFFIIKIVRNTH